MARRVLPRLVLFVLCAASVLASGQVRAERDIASPALAAPAAEARAPAGPESTADAGQGRGVASDVVRFAVGIRHTGGGLLWTQPSHTDLLADDPNRRPGDYFDLPIFNELRAGYGYGSGVFVQGQFVTYLGVEIGLYWSHHTLVEQVEWTFVENDAGTSREFRADTEEKLEWDALHVPLIVKALVPAGAVQLVFGVGVEYVHPVWQGASFELLEGEIYGPRSAFEEIRAEAADSVYVLATIGVEILAGDFFVPVDLLLGYNVLQPERYLERGSVDPQPTVEVLDPDDSVAKAHHPKTLTLKTQDTAYGMLRVGLGYRF